LNSIPMGEGGKTDSTCGRGGGGFGGGGGGGGCWGVCLGGGGGFDDAIMNLGKKRFESSHFGAERGREKKGAWMDVDRGGKKRKLSAGPEGKKGGKGVAPLRKRAKEIY